MTRASPTPQVAKALRDLLTQGDLQACESLARQTIAEFPEDASSWNILGVCLALAGRFEDAVVPLQRTAALEPDVADAHRVLGDVFHRLGRLAEAEASYARALALAPDLVDVRLGLANTLSALGRPGEAVRHLRRVVELEPHDVRAHTNLGVALRDLGRPAEAEVSCRRAIELKPGAFRAHNNLGNALKDLGRLVDAEASYRRAIECKPDYAVAHGNLGNVLRELGRLAEAEASCRRAIELAPSDASVHNVLGILLRQANRLSDARAAFSRAVEIQPRLAEAQNNLGNLLRELGEQEEAEVRLRRAIELDPSRHEFHSNLLFALHCRPHTAAESLDEARAYGRNVSARVERVFDAFSCEPDPRRLRVGLVSGDLCEHVVAYFLQGVLEHLDTARIELVAYPTRPVDDARTRGIRARCTLFRPLTGLDDDAAARAIHADGIHVLLDLAGHSAHNRLPVFARRPAPVQAGWLGYFDTTGVEQMDYVLADEVSVPRRSQGRFTERIWYLPDTRLCFSAPDEAAPVSPLPAVRAGHFTFGCFQELAKLNDGVLGCWARIFRRLPHARLRLQSRQLGDAVVRAALVERLRTHGLPAGSVRLHGPMSRQGYLAAHAEVDALLDTFPYPGGTTTCEALWMGVPTVTLSGDDMLARQGASLLTAAGLAEWVTGTQEEYVEKAVAVASDVPALAAVRASLRAKVRSSPVFDAARFTRNLETALFGMFRAKRRS